jgi:DNA-binding MarR family transcriptional regulator
MHANIIQKSNIKDISAGHFPIVRLIVEKPGICADEITKKLNLDKATVAIAIKKLMFLNLVSRNQDENDKRKKLLYPSRTLKDFSSLAIKQADENFNKMLYGFNDDELLKLDEYLERIINNLKN